MERNRGITVKPVNESSPEVRRVLKHPANALVIRFFLDAAMKEHRRGDDTSMRRDIGRARYITDLLEAQRGKVKPLFAKQSDAMPGPTQRPIPKGPEGPVPKMSAAAAVRQAKEDLVAAGCPPKVATGIAKDFDGVFRI